MVEGWPRRRCPRPEGCRAPGPATGSRPSSRRGGSRSACVANDRLRHERAAPAGAALEFRPGEVPASQSPASFVSGCLTRTPSLHQRPSSRRRTEPGRRTQPPGRLARAFPTSKTDGGGLTDCPRSREPRPPTRHGGGFRSIPRHVAPRRDVGDRPRRDAGSPPGSGPSRTRPRLSETAINPTGKGPEDRKAGRVGRE